MKQVVGLLVLLSFPGVTAFAAKANPNENGVVPVFRLKGRITEAPAPQELPFDLSGATGTPLRDLIARMRQARDDKKVDGVVLMLEPLQFGRAQAEELRAVMEELKSAGKKIHVHADSMTTGGLLLLSGGSEISMVPSGYLFITGLYGEQLFVRGLLNKLDIRPDFFTCGAYKSAAELFMRKAPSAESREMQNWLMDSMFANTVQLIAQGRGVEQKRVRDWIDEGVFVAEDARKAGIIQHVEHRQDFEARLRRRYGSDVSFDFRYGKKNSSLPDFSTPFGILQFYAELLRPSGRKVSKEDAVAIVYLEGTIVDGEGSTSPFGGTPVAYSARIRKALDETANDDRVKAVVFRVDSGGGSAVASEVILDATKRVASKKPLVVSMGNVAGSGGYYVACGAKTIFADPSTITGSIGVVSGKFATTEMWENCGINWVPYKRGTNAAMLSSFGVFSDSERKALQTYMNKVYDVFKNHVVSIRGKRLKKDIDELAGGRVYTGVQAQELGLVDHLGGIEEAIVFAANEAKLKNYDVRVVPRPKNLVEMLSAELGGKDDDTGRLNLFVPRSLNNSGLETALPILKHLDPSRTDAIIETLRHLRIMQVERVTLMTPPLVFAD